ncbi:MAG: hypothetical protein ABI182_07580 [Candidatus Baltobacteraceae bacterium]
MPIVLLVAREAAGAKLFAKPEEMEGLQRGHLQFDQNEAQLLDRAGSARITEGDERRRFAHPFGVEIAERILENCRSRGWL